MPRFMKQVNGKMQTIYPTDEICEIIKTKCEDLEAGLAYYKKLYEESQTEIYKENEFQKLQNKIEEQDRLLKNSFYLTPEEKAKIDAFYKEHSKAHEAHLSYIFTPLGIGTVGKVRCTTCCSEYTFRDL